MELVKTGKLRDCKGYLTACFHCNDTANFVKTKIFSKEVNSAWRCFIGFLNKHKLFFLPGHV